MDIKFSGINIFTPHPVRSFEFYKKLGLRVVETSEPDNRWYGAMLALCDGADEPVIWIWRSTEEAEATRNRLVFSAGEHMDEVYERIKAAGIEIEPPYTAEWGGREMALTDPDGNSILFL